MLDKEKKSPSCSISPSKKVYKFH